MCDERKKKKKTSPTLAVQLWESALPALGLFPLLRAHTLSPPWPHPPAAAARHAR